MRPIIKIISVSNVYTRMMNFISKGDVEIGHSHTFDHATLVSSGSILYEVLDGPDGKSLSSKEFKAPTAVFVEKNKFHRITALEDNTMCACIHALRDKHDDILDPEFIIDTIEHPDGEGSTRRFVEEKTGQWNPFVN